MSDLHPILVRALVQSLKDIFEKGFHADKVISFTFKNNRKFGKKDRQFLAETVYEMTRWWRRLAALDGQEWVPKNYYLRWAVYEKWRHKRDVVDFLHQRVAEAEIGVAGIDLKEGELTLGERLSYPDWFVEKLVGDYGSDAESILVAMNQQAPVYLRVNALKTDPQTCLQMLEKEEIECSRVEGLSHALVLSTRKNVFATETFKKGFFEVQDGASQRVGPLLDPQPGERVADVCAGAGGKTLHLAALMKNKGTLLAGDVHEKKLSELKLRARRAGVSNLNIQLFSSSKDVKKHYEKFDAVLIDAPCSGSGVIRRNPDSKWKMTEEEFGRLVLLQKEVFQKYARLVKPGGRLVYATCSLFREENEGQVEVFLAKNPGWKLKSSEARRPDLHGEDGFYFSRLERPK